MYELIGSLVVGQSNVSAGMKKADLDALLENKGKKYTIFAPSDKAVQDVLLNLQLTCVDAFYSAQPCSSVADLYSATNLQKLLLNFGEHFLAIKSFK